MTEIEKATICGQASGIQSLLKRRAALQQSSILSELVEAVSNRREEIAIVRMFESSFS